MCGILTFVANESVPKSDFFDELFKGAEKRGKNGTGVAIYKHKTSKYIFYKTLSAYSDDKKDILSFIQENLELNDILFGICRNAPETEVLTTTKNDIQPLLEQDAILIHNGAISENDVNKFKLHTNIDSEVILKNYYKQNKDIRKTFETISGGWSAILFDKKSKRLFAVSSFIPLAHGYAKGMGFIYHSDIDTIRSAMGLWFNREIKFTRIWEDFYVDEIPNFMIEMTDIDTGLVDSLPYQHKFEHPVWNTKEPEENNLYLVLASSGIDSTTTLALLKHFKKDVLAVHFKYGQKSEEAEYISIKKICNTLRINLEVIDLHKFFKQMDSSMLINSFIPITTDKYIKSVQAWVPLRNGIFLNMVAALAENFILKNGYKTCTICGGFPLISEESVYPDNSQRFIDGFLKYLETASIAGAQHRIKYSNILNGLTKAEELALLKYIKQEELFKYTVSCDNAIVKDNTVYQCHRKSYPACGSGRLSQWAAKKANIKDTRNYYEVEGESNDSNIPDYIRYNTSYQISKEMTEKLYQSLKKKYGNVD